MALQKQQRLYGKREIASVFSITRPQSIGGLTIRVHSGEFKSSAYAVIVPSSVARSAVARNTLKRRIVESLRAYLDRRKPKKNVHVVITVHKSALTGVEIRKSLVLLMDKSGILMQ